MQRAALAVAVAMVLLGGITLVAAAEKPPATLVGADVAVYMELDLDRLQAKTADLAPLRAALANLHVLQVAREMFSQDPEAKAVFDEVMSVIGDVTGALGGKVALAVWLPDISSLAGEALGAEVGAMEPGAEEGEEGEEVEDADEAEDVDEAEGADEAEDVDEAEEVEAFPEPKFVLIAQVRDRAKLEKLLQKLFEEAEIPTLEEERIGTATFTPFDEGGGAVRGNDWLAFGFPEEVLRDAAARAAGRAEAPSLADASAYQSAMKGMTDDAVLTAYVGPQVLQQLSAVAALLLPSVDLPSPSKDGVGVAVGLRLEEKDGRTMVVIHKTYDLASLSYLLDVPLSVGAKMLSPMLAQSRESAGKIECLSNVKNISMGVQMYAADNDRFPDADKWVDQLNEYLMSEDILKCPDDESGEKCSYGFNAALSGKSVEEIADPAVVVVIYETANPGDCPSGGPDDIASPAHHLGGSNFGYADGHAKWCREGEEVVFEETAEGEETDGEE